MDLISLYFFTLLLILLVSSFLAFINKRCTNNPKLPPGSIGYPIIGETFDFSLSGPEKFITQRMQNYSKEVFKTSMLGEKVAVVCGSPGNKFAFFSGSNFLLPWIPYPVSKLFDWLDSDGRLIKEFYTKGRHFLHEIMRYEALKHYIPIMDSMALEHLNKDWASSNQVSVYPSTQKYVLSLACKLLLGLDDPDEVRDFSELFTRTIPGLFSVPINFPGTSYHRSIKKVKKLKLELLKIVEARKKMIPELKEKEKAGSGFVDILSRMLLEGKDHFKADMEIVNNLISFLLPSYEGITATITVTLNYLAELPHVYDAVYNEHLNIAKGKSPEETLNWEDVLQMKYSWNVVREAMRLVPPAFGNFREAKIDLKFAGYTIPRGWKILWSPFTTNRDPQYFENPETFDPQRHDRDVLQPSSFAPFGGGTQMCPGKDFAKFLILVFMYNVVTKFKFKKLNPDEKIVYILGPRPENGLQVLLQQH
ncbi:OLC1v1002086C1 [Oldenlandia corymbosa var. corymbosa]|uniref:OLC1v1002086C1 n=1 Tax=Oldenlandia corymbosa var. corymbosa TaxID=529605 RepID=A0AAV1D947_OLDCO|nr:OLC1v1002086C1 [Oldenlandia corymbosa var. corymbosa]